MSSSEQPDQHAPQSDPVARKRARVWIPVAFVAAVLLVFLFILLVSRLGS